MLALGTPVNHHANWKIQEKFQFRILFLIVFCIIFFILSLFINSILQTKDLTSYSDVDQPFLTLDDFTTESHSAQTNDTADSNHSVIGFQEGNFFITHIFLYDSISDPDSDEEQSSLFIQCYKLRFSFFTNKIMKELANDNIENSNGTLTKQDLIILTPDEYDTSIYDEVYTFQGTNDFIVKQGNTIICYYHNGYEPCNTEIFIK